MVRPDLEPAPVNGCAFCGQLQRNHGMTSAGSKGLHRWVEPSNELRKQRFKENRKARQE